MKPLSYHASIRVLLEGTCGANPNQIHHETGLGRITIRNFLLNQSPSAGEQPATLDAIGMFVWRKLNAHLLLCDEDREPSLQPVAYPDFTERIYRS